MAEEGETIDAEVIDVTNSSDKALVLAGESSQSTLEKEIEQKINIIHLLGQKWNVESGKFPEKTHLSEEEVVKLDTELDHLGVSKGWSDPVSTEIGTDNLWSKNSGLVLQVLGRFPYIEKLSTVKLPNVDSNSHDLNNMYVLEVANLQKKARSVAATFLSGINFAYNPNIVDISVGVDNHSLIRQLNNEAHNIQIDDRQLTQKFQAKRWGRDFATNINLD